MLIPNTIPTTERSRSISENKITVYYPFYHSDIGVELELIAMRLLIKPPSQSWGLFLCPGANKPK